MTAEKEYFIYLLSCFLGSNQPEGRDVDWEEIYRLAEIHNVSGIISQEIQSLDEKYRPKGVLKSHFIQKLGLTLREYETKQSVYQEINTVLNEQGIDHIFVKGIVLKDDYPIPELRTSGDIDVIVRENDYLEMIQKLKKCGLTFREPVGSVTANIVLNSTEVEIHRYHDVKSDYFSDIFSLCHKKEKCLYELGQYDHMLYVLCHLAKHLTQNGAGIKMLMDLDVMVRSFDRFDEAYFYSLCEKANRRKTAEILLSLCFYFFQTPVTPIIDFQKEDQLLGEFESVMIDGGSFGFETGDLADFHLVNNVSSNGRITPITKVKTVFHLFFPPKEYVMQYYEYLNKRRYLLPLAYLNRIFDAAFKRGKHSAETVGGIMTHKNNHSVQYELLKELEIEPEY